MKKLFLPFVAALALTGCTNDEPGGPLDENGTGDGYLAIDIATTPEGGSRYEQDGSKFEDGTDEENKVTSVRFYFFTNAGAAVYIAKGADGKDINYKDWTPDDGSEGADHTTTVEKILKAVLVLDTKSSKAIPSQIVAVLNPSEYLKGQGALTRPNLYNSISEDYAAKANSTGEGSFVMANSVYMTEASKDRVFAATISANNIQKSEEDAKEHPVVIYVERNVAKVRVKSSLSTTEKTDKDGKKHNLLLLKSGKKADITVDDEKGNPKQIYLDITGWNVTATLKYAYLIKHIDTSWPSSLFPDGLNWNAPRYFRSYWAAPCHQLNNEKNQYGNFNDAQNKTLEGYTYCNENAQKETGDIKPTKVIIAGTLCDEDANPLTICEFASSRMIGEEALKDLYLGMIQSHDVKYYYKTTEKNEEGQDVEKYIQIGTNGKKIDDETYEKDYSDIKFITFAEAIDAGLVTGTITHGLENNGCYYSYCCLTDAAKEKQWYTFDKNDQPQAVDYGTINAKLIEAGHCKIWKSGMTYYYQDIEHVPTTDGTTAKYSGIAGVVRNHIYEFNLKSILGLGTPVYNPDEVIYPERPVDDDSYIAAQVKILSWRLVSSDLTLDWGD